jgi:hypothetical protein
MMQNARTTPMADSEAGMRSLRMSHARVRVLLVLSPLNLRQTVFNHAQIHIRVRNTHVTEGNRRATIMETGKIAILAKTGDLGELHGNEIV